MKDSSFELVEQAARYASVDKEIQGFPAKYNTMIGERGVTLSGGQKQRISIARALIKNPRVVVFDDCLSAVDARTEKEIIGNLYRFLQNKTAIIITHRIFSLFDFDTIIVLDEGRIAEQGTHQELLTKNGYYRYLYEQQQQQQERSNGGTASATEPRRSRFHLPVRVYNSICKCPSAVTFSCSAFRRITAPAVTPPRMGPAAPAGQNFVVIRDRLKINTVKAFLNFVNSKTILYL